MSREIVTPGSNKDDIGVFGLSQKFASLNHLILRDLNKNYYDAHPTVFSQTHGQDLWYLSFNLHRRNHVKSFTIIVVYNPFVYFARINPIRLYDVSQVCKSNKVLDKPSKMRACPINISYR